MNISLEQKQSLSKSQTITLEADFARSHNRGSVVKGRTIDHVQTIRPENGLSVPSH
jgi:hypothetical protein